ncbi:MAG: hypothetical protein NUV91_00140, partial [Candidatus Omnitrophica bacterium]|nr:hypothetical protein [Candidatus Omnitrophota bacterium]
QDRTQPVAALLDSPTVQSEFARRVQEDGYPAQAPLRETFQSGLKAINAHIEAQQGRGRDPNLLDKRVEDDTRSIKDRRDYAKAGGKRPERSIESLVEQLRSDDPGKSAEARAILFRRYQPMFERRAMDMYYVFKYISERLAGAAFFGELDDFVQEALLVGEKGLQKFAKLEATAKVAPSYLLGRISHHFFILMAERWQIKVGEAEKMYKMVRRAIELEKPAEALDLEITEVIAQIPSLVQLRDEAEDLIESSLYRQPLTKSMVAEFLAILEEHTDKVLTEREKEVIEMSYGLGKFEREYTDVEIARVFDVAKSRPRQILQHALRKMRGAVIEAVPLTSLERKVYFFRSEVEEDPHQDSEDLKRELQLTDQEIKEILESIIWKFRSGNLKTISALEKKVLDIALETLEIDEKEIQKVMEIPIHLAAQIYRRRTLGDLASFEKKVGEFLDGGWQEQEEILKEVYFLLAKSRDDIVQSARVRHRFSRILLIEKKFLENKDDDLRDLLLKISPKDIQEIVKKLQNPGTFKPWEKALVSIILKHFPATRADFMETLYQELQPKISGHKGYLLTQPAWAFAIAVMEKMKSNEGTEIVRQLQVTWDDFDEVLARAVEKRPEVFASKKRLDSYRQGLGEADFWGGLGEEEQVRLERDLVDQEIAEPLERARPLTFDEEDRLLDFLEERFSSSQMRRMALVLKGYPVEQIVTLTGSQSSAQSRSVADEVNLVLKRLRYVFTLGMLDEFGSMEQVRNDIIRLTSESPLERIFRRINMNSLLEISQGDVTGISEVIAQLYPGLYEEADVESVLKEHFGDLIARIQKGPHKIEARQVLGVVRHAVEAIGSARARRREMVLRRLLRDQFYPLIRADIERGTTTGRAALEIETTRRNIDPFWQRLVQDTLEYYDQVMAFQPRGFRQQTEFGEEPLLPAQRFGVWEAVQSLENPKYESALHASEARIGKTIMAALSVFNIRDGATGDYAVKRLLYTTTNQAKYEVAQELKRRTDLDLQIIVLDSEQGDRKQQIEEATRLAKDGTKNVVIIANYEAVRDFPDEVVAFKPDAHIIDEVENLKGGEETARAPKIFDIPAKYRVAVSARLVVNESEDVVEVLLWTRHNQYLPEGKEKDVARRELAAMNGDQLFEALDPIKVRWRRRVVLPELPQPETVIEYVEYTPLYDQAVWQMQQDFVEWKRIHARPDKATVKDHLFARYEFERRASVDLGLVVSEDEWVFVDADGQKTVLGVLDNEIELEGRRFTRSRERTERGLMLEEVDGEEVIGIPHDPTGQTFQLNGKEFAVEKRRRDLMDESAKIQRLDEIVREEIGNDGKVVVLVDFIEEIDRLVERYNRIHGEGVALGTYGDVPLKDRVEGIYQFRSGQNPSILIGTTQMLGSSLNLFQLPGRPFHISTLVRLSRPWVNIDDGDRLVGIGQTHPVKVMTLVSRFREETRQAVVQPQVPESAEVVMTALAPQVALTIEERLERKLTEKRQIFAHVVDGAPIIDDQASQQLTELAADLLKPGETDRSDEAILVSVGEQEVGGIDLTQSSFDIQRSGEGIQWSAPFEFDYEALENIPINGFVPVIINIRPAKQLPLFLGLEEEPAQQKSL